MIKPIEKTFKENLKTFEIDLTEKQLEQFRTYYQLLTTWNEKINLTAITEYEEVLTKHFLDSLSIAKIFHEKKPNTLIDIGTGAGFPGIPIKIIYPEIKITLLDSLQKRIGFLNEVINQLKLSEIYTIHGRAEDYAKPGKLREQFDVCVSRAVANLSTLSELCIPFVKTNGKFISYKSEKADEEIANAKNAILLLGGDQVEKISFVLPNTDYERNLVIINKKQKTSSKYPRKAGTPGKQPL